MDIAKLAWPAAFAFVGLCASIAYYNVNYKEPENAQIACIKARGKWMGNGWSMASGTCDFSSATAAAK